MHSTFKQTPSYKPLDYHGNILPGKFASSKLRIAFGILVPDDVIEWALR